jgi:hypothetical protein
VPAQNCCGRDEQADPARAGQSADQGRDQCPIRPGHPRLAGLAAQHRELMTKHEDLDQVHQS